MTSIYILIGNPVIIHIRYIGTLLERLLQRKSKGFSITQRFDENSYSSGTRKQRQPLLPSPLPCPQTPASSSPTVVVVLSLFLVILPLPKSEREREVPHTKINFQPSSPSIPFATSRWCRCHWCWSRWPPPFFPNLFNFRVTKSRYKSSATYLWRDVTLGDPIAKGARWYCWCS